MLCVGAIAVFARLLLPCCVQLVLFLTLSTTRSVKWAPTLLFACSRPQQPQPLQQQQQQQPLVHPPSSSTRNNTNNSTNNSLQQGPLRPGQLLSPPSRIVLSPREELRAARKLDDSDTRMAAYDALVVQVWTSVGVWWCIAAFVRW